MNRPPTRDELIGALIRHPDLKLKAARSRDVWTLINGEPLAPEVEATIDQRIGELPSALAIEAESARVDHVRVTVHYTEGSASALRRTLLGVG